MANTVQLTKNGQPVFPVTDVSLVMGLQDAIKLPPVKVATLPTASADTAGKMYYVGPTDGEYERYITSAVNGSYDWIDLGNTAIPLPSIADNLTTDDPRIALSAAQGKVLDGKVSQLGQKVTDNTGDIQSLQNQMDNYRPIVIEGNVENAPDEEDITTDENDLLKFANRAAHTNYLGYVILRKGKTFASQVTVPNTIYEIRYDFSLEQDEVVTIPTGCILNFVGGSVKSGSIVFQNTLLSGGISFIGVSASGSIANEESRPEWFGAKRDGITDDADAVISSLAVSNNVRFSMGTYCISKPIIIENRKGVVLSGDETILWSPSYTKGGAYGTRMVVFGVIKSENIVFRNLAWESVCDKEGIPPTGHTRNNNLSSNIVGISLLGSKGIRAFSCKFTNMESDFFFNSVSDPSSEIEVDDWYSRGSLMPFYGSGLSNLVIRNADVEMSEYSGDGDHALYIGSTNNISVYDSVFNIYNGNTESATLLTFHGSTNSKNLFFSNVKSERCGQFVHFGDCDKGTLKNCSAVATITGQNCLVQVSASANSPTQIAVDGCDLSVNIDMTMFAMDGVGVEFVVKNSKLYNVSESFYIFGGGSIVTVDNCQISCPFTVLYGANGNTLDATFRNCIIDFFRQSTGFLFSLRDSRDTLLIFGCLIRSKYTQSYAMYNGGSLTDINFVTILSSQIINFTNFAQATNNHGGNFVNSYINGALMVANP